MPQGIEAPASTTAEGLTSHTQNPDSGRRVGALSDLQISQLLRPVNPDRVGEDGKGFAHMEAWDIRRHLIRIFGFGGHDTDLLETTLIAETSIPNYQKVGKNGQPYGKVYEAWTVVYRVAVRLTVKVDGIQLGHWHGVATGDATHQPSRADAHDLALKTADSQALKRAATNLGDQFGLSLYNKGSLNPVVQASLPYWKAPKEADFKDDKVEPEPEVAAARQETELPEPRSGAAERPAQPSQPTPGPPSERLSALLRQVADCWNSNNLLIFNQIGEDGSRHGVLDEAFTDKRGAVTTLRKVLDDRIAEIQAAQDGSADRSAA
ncbi:Rad52/Rad22 family DNA repair protein [Streptomyces pseudogriseolus]|uniref:Rad52/Rad22 family DNA repair protein n=1 Tax=Streptomyces pseudogriseolus TaxID=36817 RepID=UPI003FA2C62D